MSKSNVGTNSARVRRSSAHVDASSVIGDSPTAEELRATIRRVAASWAETILITGESGTGKGLVARAIHGESPRRASPFISITCSAVPGFLLESELFGHEAGAFTDGRQRKIGLLEAADGGTLFLDEIGDMPPALQAKLLGVLEERRIRRLGGVKEIPIDVRVISATHRDLPTLVREGLFRQDLYYRLSVVPVRLRPLRERMDDIGPLMEHFLEQLATSTGKRFRLTERAMLHVCHQPWPGNVRELRNGVERAAVLAEGLVLDVDAFCDPRAETPFGVALPAAGLNVENLIDGLLREAMQRTGGNQSAAARLLGLTRSQVRHRLQRLGLLERESDSPGSGSAAREARRSEASRSPLSERSLAVSRAARAALVRCHHAS